MTTHHRYLDRLLTRAIGTSYAAPGIAHKAARVLRAFPEASANLVRALLASSASIPEAASRRLEPLGDEAVINACGYGLPDVTRAITSDDNRVVLYADDQIAFDRFYVYEVPVPTEFTETRGNRKIQVTLAFDPPTRHTRVDYLGCRMSFRLIRGATLEEVIEHYRHRGAEEPVPEMDGNDCPFDFGPTIRERGTLQRAVFAMARNPGRDYGETYFLVVRCERRWAPEEYGPQRFAVVIEMLHENEARLYERIRERIRVRVRA